MAQRRRYDANANVIMTRVGCTDLAALSKAMDASYYRRDLAALANEKYCKIKKSFKKKHKVRPIREYAVEKQDM